MASAQPSNIERVEVVRPVRFSIGPSFKAQVVESNISRFDMKVDPLSASEQRMSWSFRSPALGVLADSTLILETQWRIVAPANMNIASVLGPQLQICDVSTGVDVGAGTPAESNLVAQAPKLAFSQGDGFQKSITSIMATVNGASVSNARLNDYQATLQKCWMTSEVAQKRFQGCGGAFSNWDATSVSGQAFSIRRLAGAETYAAFGQGHAFHATAPGANGFRGHSAMAVSALTGDTGVTKRINNLMACTTSLPAVGTYAPARNDVRIITCHWPVSCAGLFTPFGIYDELSDSCPYKNSSICIPHLNIVNLEILFKDLKQNLFRNLMGTRIADVGAGGVLATGSTPGGFDISLVAGSPSLYVKYLRLASWRNIPATIDLAIYRNSVHDLTSETSTGTVVCTAAVTRDGVPEQSLGLVCSGSSRGNGIGRLAGYGEASQRTVLWSGVTVSQAPQYIAFVLQKSSDMYCLGGVDLDDAFGRPINSWNYTAGVPAADQGRTQGLQNYFISRNTDASASIQQFEITISSSVGSYRYAGTSFPRLRSRKELFKDVQRYCVSDYCNSDFDVWRKHNGIIYLGSDAILRGLCSPGSAFPLVINAQVQFGSEREFCDGHAACSQSETYGFAVQRDPCFGRPVMVCQYGQNSLSLSPSSGILSSQNMSHSSAMSLLSRGQ